jgi:type I restriction enzyme R subunit
MQSEALMKSQNFEFLRPRHRELADLGGFAESYARTDPAAALVKMRSFIESVVAIIYETYRLPRPYSDNIFDLLSETSFRATVPIVVLNKFHFVRKAGNRAAHHEPPSAQVALQALREVFDIGQWLHLGVDKGKRTDCPTFKEPSPPAVVDTAALQKEKKEALDKLAQQEAQLQALLAALEEERRKREAAEKNVEHTASELEALKAEGQKAANVLHLNEEATRHRLIDEELLEAGWDVGPNGKSTEQVKQEVRFSSMPTESGEGYADYVLYGDDGKPLAVVEAKKTAKDARIGAEQARIYAMCLEKETGQRPVVFYTNGIDIFIWDDAHPHLSAQQLRFLQLLKNHIAQNGGIDLERLYEPPFTTLHASGIDGVFTEKGQIDELLLILEAFQPKRAAPSNPPPESKRA